MNNNARLFSYILTSMFILTSCGSASSNSDDTESADSVKTEVKESKEEPKEEPIDPALKEVYDRGREDAIKALQYPANSPERTHAILEIRAAETRLRQNGYDHSADTYVRGAESALRAE